MLCEKPVALCAPEAETLIEARERTGRQVQEAFMVRHHPQWLKARELIRGGRIGRARRRPGEFRIRQPGPPKHPQPTRNRRRRALRHRLLPDGDLALRVRGRAHGRDGAGGARPGFRHRPSGERRLRLSRRPGEFRLLDASGATSESRRSRNRGMAAGGVPLRHGADPALPPVPRRRRFSRPPRRTKRWRFHRCDQYTAQGDAVSLCLREGRAVPWPIEDGVANMRALDAVFASVRSGRWETVGG